MYDCSCWVGRREPCMYDCLVTCLFDHFRLCYRYADIIIVTYDTLFFHSTRKGNLLCGVLEQTLLHEGLKKTQT